MSEILLEQKERKMRPQWWVLTFSVYVIGLLIGAGLMIGPLFLVVMFPSIGIYLTLLAIPLGVYIFRKVLSALQGRIWVNTHLSEYLLYDDRVEYTVWDPKVREKKEGVVPLSAVTELYYGMHVFHYNYTYRPTKLNEPLQQLELLPMLYLVHHHQFQRQMLAIPFTNVVEANRWLEIVAKEEKPLWLTSVTSLHDYYVGDVPEELSGDIHLERARFDGNIDVAYRPYMAKITQQQAEEAAKQRPPEEQRQRLKEEQKKRRAFPGIGRLAWLVFPLQYAGGLLVVRLAAEGKINPEGLALPLLLIGVCGLLFFLLVKWMKWPQILIYAVVSLISFLFVDTSEVETDPSYVASSMLLGISVFSPLLLSVIYVIVRSIRSLREGGKHADDSGVPS